MDRTHIAIVAPGEVVGRAIEALVRGQDAPEPIVDAVDLSGRGPAGAIPRHGYVRDQVVLHIWDTGGPIAPAGEPGPEGHTQPVARVDQFGVPVVPSGVKACTSIPVGQVRGTIDLHVAGR